MELIIPILLNCVLVTVMYLTEKNTPFRKLPYMARQLIIGLLFGGSSAFASSYGIELLGTVVNIRDAAPLIAGLIFGAPAGILSGFIGGLYRWFSVFWGGGTYTRLACTLATILVGFISAGLRKLMFDDKKPTWVYGIIIAVVCEVIHMMLIFLTNMSNSSQAFEFVRQATLPMILGNATAVGVSIIIVSLISHDRLIRNKKGEKIAQTFQRWLLICIVFAFLVTSTFTYFLQSGIARVETQEIFTAAIADVEKDVRTKSEDYMLSLVGLILRDHLEDRERPLEDIAGEYGVAEINIVDQNGIIQLSTLEGVAGVFDMASTEQSKEFLILNEGYGTYVQEYRPMGKEEDTMRKYAGIALPEGGFIQVGYSSDQFYDLLDSFVVDVTQNRHVGSKGFVAVCNEDLMLVTHDEYNDKHISSIGIEPNEEMLQGVSASKLYTATVINPEQDYAEEYAYVFTFAEGYCIIAAMSRYDMMFMRDASLYTSVFMQVQIFASLFVFIYILIKQVIINNLRRINNSLAQITEGNLNVTVDVRSNAEFASLSDDINTTVSTLKRYIAEAAARIDKELEYAKQIQLSALPTNFPDKEDFTIYANMIAAKEVGGDFYDFYRIDEDTVAFLAADVSGKGIPAAMFMMTAKTILKDLAESGLPVNEIFTRANEKLCENNESGMFVTAWMGILDLPTGRLQYANAGHNPPLVRHAGGEFTYLRSRAGFVLAGMEGVRYRVNEMQLQPADRIFLYTDGVTEATDLNETLYGEERLAQFMNGNKTMPSTQLLPALKDNIDLFVGEAPQFDDITMLMFDYKPARVPPAEERIFPAKVEALDQVIEFVEDTMQRFGCVRKLVTAVCVVVEELFVNIANYAYEGADGNMGLSIGFDPTTRDMTFRLWDWGVPFDPLKKPDPDITLSAEERQIGGLGIFITKKTMDSVTYAYENGQNILTMTKNIE